MPVIRIDYDDAKLKKNEALALSEAIQKIVSEVTNIEDVFVYANSSQVKVKIAPVEIGDGAFLGEGCVILKGVRVGKRAVVGANAVVTRDVPDFAVVAGVPAGVVKSVSPTRYDA